MEQVNTSDYRIKVGITQGDINGIGYEIILKAFADNRLLDMFTPIVYGSSKVASYHKKILNVADINLNLIKKADLANAKRINIVNVFDDEIKIDMGKMSPIAGQQAMLALDMAIADLKNKHIDVLVTAPIHKKNMKEAGFQFAGHTEFLAHHSNGAEPLMLLINDDTRIGVVTGHIPLREVASVLTPELIVKKINIMHASLIQDFGIRKPKIALLGLNPHAGDEGAIGNEEQTIIKSAIEQANKSNKLVYGPFAADGFFGSSEYKKYDGILAMYHDQGLIPFKALCFDNGVNFTAGLPIIRTSPAHGTGYEIAGQNIASEQSLRAALYMACDIYRNREEYQQITSNPLKKSATAQMEEDN